MKLLNVHCTNCGAAMKVTENAKVITCEYCNQDFVLDDEVKRFMLANAEQAGYEFEKGRQRAKEEAIQEAEGKQPINVACTNCGERLVVKKKDKTACCCYCKAVFDVETAIDLNTGLDHLENREYDYAILMFNKVLERLPENMVAQHAKFLANEKLKNHVYYRTKIPCVFTKDETIELRRYALVHIKSNGKEVFYYYDKMTNIKEKEFKWIQFDYPGHISPVIFITYDGFLIQMFIEDAKKGIYTGVFTKADEE